MSAHRRHHALMLLYGAIVTYFNMAPLVSLPFDENAFDPQPAANFREAFLNIRLSNLWKALSRSFGACAARITGMAAVVTKPTIPITAERVRRVRALKSFFCPLAASVREPAVPRRTPPACAPARAPLRNASAAAGSGRDCRV